ncbi:DUF2617 family protein [Micromonospora sp. WMMD1128]|uniref:DUF2617 family protein n=1 Tax=unclassified Micromonospora TaxID=2617518 RepID=UPI00248AB645|nr:MULTISPECIES: DUF2617 family protein [unclassified Micromonospora]WBB73558.1 DUF2617 family protein [Micromonospora sp. WMMD1128]WFE33053.1 DUF2617 family protein [Micromonospora sp. WMMD975]
MLIALAAPYVDSRAADLSLSLGGPELPALAVRDLDLPGGRPLRLRLLGASHQVVAGALTETVACLPGRRPHLPDALHDATTGYRFTATVLRPTGDGLRARVAALRAELADDPHALVGVFPGDEDAVTALAVRPDPPDGAVAWRTWHAYPQTNELVLTETVVEEL